ncbi:MAG: Aminomethyltransferase [Verrucomicrobia subdivision 3 bacterium]|nr:Aminomethyltransferase [Limisphaerales bacterium]MCS1412537.1 Aminomethyltransferase [Limisphaerales bacterium]
MLKRNALYEIHQSLGAKLVKFGGWEMPVQYSGIIGEHLAVRSGNGLFDISHLGEIFVSGKDARHFINSVLANDGTRLDVGEKQYTSLSCNDSGGVINDM